MVKGLVTLGLFLCPKCSFKAEALQIIPLLFSSHPQLFNALETNIDKEYFNKRFGEYMTIKDRQVDNWFYQKYLHNDIRTIIHNVTFHFEFNSEQFLYEDVEADLLLHLQLKKDCMRKYQGNWYNIVFTSFKRKFYDILRSNKVVADKVNALLETCQDHLSLTYELEDEQEPEKVDVMPVIMVDESRILKDVG